MKVSASKTFTPIELTITIESAKELESLWHRFNVCPSKIVENSSAFNSTRGKYVTSQSEIFKVLDTLAVNLGLQS